MVTETKEVKRSADERAVLCLTSHVLYFFFSDAVGFPVFLGLTGPWRRFLRLKSWVNAFPLLRGLCCRATGAGR